MKINEVILESAIHTRPVNELAPDAGGGGSGDYFQALASAWYNHDISILADIARKGGSPMKKIMDAQEAVEKMLQRGVIGSDGKTRKYDITYNSDFDGVVIQSADYYEYSDYDAAGNEVDSRTGRPWGPNDYMQFDGDELDEGMYESTELVEEFDLIESIIERLAAHNGVDAEVIWEDLETLTEDELYAFAVTSEPIMESQGVTEAFGLYGPFTVTINTGERPQSRTKTKKFRREDDAILYAEDWLEDAPQYVFATAKVTDPEGNVVWTTDEQGVAEDNSRWTVKYWDKQVGNDALEREFASKEQAEAFLLRLPSSYAKALRPNQGVAEGSDFFAGSKFADEEGNTFSVEKIIAFAKKNPKYFHKDFPLSKIKHDLSWWQGNKERMMNADTSFPLLVIQNDDGHLGVADGLNRMKKAVDVEKRTTIDVYLVPKKDIMKFSEKQDVAEDWQKANKRDRTDGMSQKAVNAYRRENPGSKLKTAVTTKPGKLKKGGKASKRRKSYCSRSRGQMKMHSISCAKTPDKAICKARRRWNC